MAFMQGVVARLKLQQHGSEPYTLLAVAPTLIAGVSLLASAAFLAADGFGNGTLVSTCSGPLAAGSMTFSEAP